MTTAVATTRSAAAASTGADVLGAVVVGLTAFLTLVDLFAAQAILPALALAYGVMPGAIAVAVNACTFGMAAAALGIALLQPRLDRRRAIIAALALLSLPTALLAHAPDLLSFALLRIAQGLFMAAAFVLTLAHLGDRCASAGVFAAYVTGNVASNLVGRLVAAAVADHLDLAAAFYVFAGLNLLGALLVLLALPHGSASSRSADATPPAPRRWQAVLRAQPLRASLALGFCILFAFIGTFSYVNFVLAREPFAIAPMMLGAVYLVFLPAIVTTPLTGAAAERLGSRQALWAALAVAGAGLPLLLLPVLGAVLAGLALVAVGTFSAQAIATGFVSRSARTDRAAASGLYLAAYFSGGLVGSALLGQIFDRFGWASCVLGIAFVLAAAAILARKLETAPAGE